MYLTVNQVLTQTIVPNPAAVAMWSLNIIVSLRKYTRQYSIRIPCVTYGCKSFNSHVPDGSRYIWSRMMHLQIYLLIAIEQIHKVRPLPELWLIRYSFVEL